MTLRTTVFYIILLLCFYVNAQVEDDFSDGDFTADPTWSGNASDFEVDGDLKLHLNAAAATAESYIATASTLMDKTIWEFYVEMGFNPSSGNQLFVYLASDQEDLTGALNGYLVRLGNTEDEVSLYKQSGTTLTKIIDGQDDVLDVSTVGIRVKVVRDENGNWELLRDADGGTSYTSEGSVNDVTLTSSAYFGFRCDYTSTRSTLFWMDEIAIDQVRVDTVVINSSTEIEVTFNQQIAQPDVENIANYSIGGLTISSATQDDSDATKVVLALDETTPLTTSDYTLNIEAGLTKNASTAYDFSYVSLDLESLLTLSDTEVQLTFNAELDEISAETLSNYSIDNGIGQPTAAELDDEDQKVVTLTLANPLFESTTFQLTVSSVENKPQNNMFSGTEDFTFIIPVVIDTLEAISANQIIVRFNKTLNQSIAETETNYSLDGSGGNPTTATLLSDAKSVELTFGADFSDATYTLTVNDLEDTDGNKIAADSQDSFDYLNLAISSVTQIDDLSILVSFNQDVDESTAENAANYSISEIGTATSAVRSSSNQNQVTVSWSELYNSMYELTVSGVANADLNSTPDQLEASFSISKATEERSVLISEFLADPTPVIGLPDAEYVELYNPTAYSINLEDFELNGEAIPAYQLESEAYVLLTDDSNIANFVLDNGVALTGFDALTNSGESIVLKDQLGNLIDSLQYDLTWYQDDSKKDGGFSLELIDPLQPCSDQSNWLGSSDESGGTPGRMNAVFDDQDNDAPKLLGVIVLGDTLYLTFSEPIEESSITTFAFILSGYTFDELVQYSYSEYGLILNEDLTSEVAHELSVSSISDCRGNTLAAQSFQFYHDVKPPEVVHLYPVASNEIALIFDEPLDKSTVEQEELYEIIGFTVDRATLQDSTSNRLHLLLDTSLTPEMAYTLSYSGIRDTLLNAASSNIDFTYSNQLDSAYVETPNLLVIRYKVIPSTSSCTETENYLLEETGDRPVTVVQDEQEKNKVRLYFENNFKDNSPLRIFVENLFNEAEDSRLSTPAYSFVYDTRSPTVRDLRVLNDSQLVVTYSEPVEVQSATLSSHYELEDNEQPIAIELLSSTEFRLTFNAKFVQEAEKSLYISSIADRSDNTMSTRRKTDFVFDTQPPQLLEAEMISEVQLVLFFSEKLEAESATTLDNFDLNASTPSAIVIQPPDSTTLLLTFPHIDQQLESTIEVYNVSDQLGNAISAAAYSFNTLQPRIVNTLARNDSSVSVFFSQGMSSTAEDLDNYMLSDHVLVSLEIVSDLEIKLSIEGAFEDGDSLNLSVTGLVGTNGESVQSEKFSGIYRTYLEHYQLINNQTILIDFETALSVISKTNFSLTDNSIVLATLDGDDKSLVRLSLKNPLDPNTSFTLRWSDLTDIYSRSLPDFAVSLLLDTNPPEVKVLESDFLSLLTLSFSEMMDDVNLKAINKYQIIGHGNPSSAKLIGDSAVVLDFEDDLEAGVVYELVVYPLADLSGNLSERDTILFTYTPPALPSAGEILINEIMADPSPVVDLPEAEFVELLNISEISINLKGLVFADLGKAVALPDYYLDPGAFVLLVPKEAVDSFDMTNIVGLDGFPSLGNTSDGLVLRTIFGDTIHSVNYEISWYEDASKNDGGYSLEMIDPAGLCTPEVNWSASTALAGGTPGAINAVYRSGADGHPPSILSVKTISMNEFKIVFEDPMDSLSMTELTLEIDGYSVMKLTVSGAYHNELVVMLSEELVLGVNYLVSVSGAKNCTGEPMKEYVTRIGMGRVPEPGELIITEIMADPEPVVGLPNVEYLELFNTTNDLISIENIRLSDATDSVNLPSVIIPAGGYLVLTSDTTGFGLDSLAVEVSNFPSLSNTGETITLFNTSIIDQVTYTKNWYHDTDKSDGGYSLELINPASNCPASSNWTGSTHENGGTPGYQNAVHSLNPDSVLPTIKSLDPISTSSFRLTFSEPMDSLSLVEMVVAIDDSTITSRSVGGADFNELTFELDNELPAGSYYVFTISGSKDCSGNEMDATTQTVGLGRVPESGELIITEIMADPEPVVGLPNVEYLELFNTTNDLISIENIRLTDATDSVNLPSVNIPAGGYLVLTSDTTGFGLDSLAVEVSNFPSLSNTGEAISLFNTSIIDQVTYTKNWYHDTDKSDGGYSLELINPSRTCPASSNWTGSTHENGGTPGVRNSVYDLNPDSSLPTIKSLDPISTTSFRLTFSELMDSLSLVEMVVAIDDFTITSRSVGGADFNELSFELDNELPAGSYYDFTISGAKDCSGNEMDATTQTVGLGRVPEPGELIFTEIMADPEPVVGLPNVEYLELFNTTSDLISIENIRLSDATDSVNLPSVNIPAGGYLVLTSDTTGFGLDSLAVEVSNFPSLSNTGEIITLFNTSIIDQVTYTKNWYHDTDKSDGGYSFELINPASNCPLGSNWTGSTHENGGTPGYQNAVHSLNPDSVLPTIKSLDPISTTSFRLTFSELMDSLSLVEMVVAIDDFTITSRSVGGADFNELSFELDNELPAGSYYDFTISGAKDCSGNEMDATTQTVGLGRVPEPGELIFTEIMADPEPVVGLPNVEYLELFNTTNDLISIENIRLTDATDSVNLPSVNIPADGYLVLTSDTTGFGLDSLAVEVSNFPSLSNTGEIITLFNTSIIDQVTYTKNWYHDTDKSDGGYSFELINPSSTCPASSNWTGSTHENGGTPGVRNSVYDLNPDSSLPTIKSLDPISTTSFRLTFSELMDSLSLVEMVVAIDDFTITSRSVGGADFNELTFELDNELPAGSYYVFTISGAKDCSGNEMDATTQTVGLGRVPEPGELIFTEIMADPEPVVGLPNVEYLELFNTTSDLISIENIRLSDATDSVNLPSVNIPAGGYLVLTSDTTGFGLDSLAVEVSNFPSLSNTGEIITLFNTSIIDQVTYTKNWYHDTDKSDGGYSFELINPSRTCPASSNWTGSTHENGGTPGVRNSVYDLNPDSSLPTIKSLDPISTTSFRLTFSELMDSLSLVEMVVAIDDFTITSRSVGGADFNELSFELDNELPAGSYYDFTISGAKDCSGNEMDATTQTVGLGRVPEPGELIFTEIMADPEPVVGLPNVEYLELFNTTSDLISIENIRLSDATDSVNLPSVNIPAGGYLVLTSDTTGFGLDSLAVEVSNFPSLSNTGEIITLFNTSIIDQVTYTKNWYHDTDKSDGGYSFELINPASNCPLGSNWTGSTHENGGTPGYQNAVHSLNPDSVLPTIKSLDPISTTSFRLTFSELMDSLSLVEMVVAIDDFTITSRSVGGADFNELSFELDNELPAGSYYVFTISGAKDCSGNEIETTTQTVGLGRAPEPGELIFTEIMADPEPVVGLPNVEYLELFNTTNDLISIENIRLTDATDSVNLPSVNIPADGYLVLTSDTTGFGLDSLAVEVSNFPSLSNTGEAISLFNTSIIDQVTYTKNWYHDTDKSDGGYSLELINPSRTCPASSNWTGSTHENGGTPGVRNSVYDLNPDSSLPTIKSLDPISTTSFRLTFSELMDSLSLVEMVVAIDDFTITSRSVGGADFNELSFELDNELPAGSYYDFTISGAKDCSGNEMDATTQTVGLGRAPEPGELIITEIMADPEPVVGLPNVEYLELFNTTSDLISIENIRLTDATDSVNLPSVNIPAGGYLVLTSDTTGFGLDSLAVEVSNFPSLSNTGEAISLFNTSIIDQVTYTKNWYHDTDKSDGGYSLELINPSSNCPASSNWTGSTHENGGTPGYQNAVHSLNPDSVLPTIKSLDPISTTSFRLTFSEPMDSLSLVEMVVAIDDFTITSRSVGGADFNELSFELDNELPAGSYYVFTISGAKDCSGNEMDATTQTVGLGRVPEPGELIITEIMADPEPVVGLPNVEYLELFNTTNDLISIENIRLSDATDSVNLPSVNIPAGGYLVLTSDTTGFGLDSLAVEVSNFPSLSNTGEDISLFNTSIIDQVTYTKNWYHDTDKSDGGYSFELINPASNCPLGSNWTGSTHENGGTPGYQNAVHSLNPDSVLPTIKSLDPISTTSFRLTFSVPMDSLSLVEMVIVIDDYEVISRSVGGADFNELTFELDNELPAGSYYVFTISGAKDCSGNEIETTTQTVGLGRAPEPGELIFTEIMADPEPVVGLPNVEYVEIFNVSDDLISLYNLKLADATDSVNLPSVNIPAGGYLVLTSDTTGFGLDSLAVEVSNFPSLSNTGEIITLFNTSIIDQVTYTKNWYHDTDKSDGGYSFELINPASNCPLGSNWTGSTHENGGTPGYQNAVHSLNPDSVLPTIKSLDPISTTSFRLTFSEPMDSLSLVEMVVAIDDFTITSRSVGGADFNELTFELDNELPAGSYYDFTISGAKDCSGNEMDATTQTVGLGRVPEPGELIFTEIMADPEPVVGLPNVEYVEIFNVSDDLISLYNLKLAEATDTVNLPSVNIPANGYLVLAADTTGFGLDSLAVEVSNFPSLSNTGEIITLFNTSIIDQVTYTKNWYHDTDKSDGGYSFELINPASNCPLGSNWTGSTNENGGTPGVRNSVYDLNPDSSLPSIQIFEVLNAKTFKITCNEPMDSLSLVEMVIVIDDYEVISRSVGGADFNELTFELDNELPAGSYYDFTISGAKDCSGNEMDATTQTVGLGRAPESGELIIIEIMADPEPVVGLPNVEYLELFNTTSDLISIENIRLSDATDSVNLPSVNIPANGYLVLAADTTGFGLDSLAVEVSNFPSLSNTGEAITLFNTSIIDQVTYTKNWYHDTDKSDGGYSLELINPSRTCPASSNWTGSTHENGGTPGYQNAVHSLNPDSVLPTIKSLDPISTTSFRLTFSEPMDSLSLVEMVIVIDDYEVISRSVGGADFNELTFELDNELPAGSYYDFTISGAKDCSGNEMDATTQTVGLGRVPEPGELIFTEIMADPEPVVGLPNVEYLELFNTTSDLISIENIRLSDATDSVNLPSVNIPAGGYLVLTSDTTGFGLDSLAVEVSNFPSLSNTGEIITLFNTSIIDQVTYTKNWYHDTDKSDGGYSFELINPASNCPLGSNWTGSTHENGGTPGYQNAVHSLNPDSVLPTIKSLDPISTTSFRLTFSEPMDSLSLVEMVVAIDDFTITSRSVGGADFNELTFELDNELPAGSYYDFTISGAKDCSGNEMDATTQTVGLGRVPEPGELIFTEIMADPEPVVGLPNVEYVEIFNVSDDLIDLGQVRYSDASDTVELPAISIPGQSYFVLCPQNKADLFSQFGLVIGLESWPNLSNSGEQLKLIASYTVAEVIYSQDWYRISEKRDGGYALEVINPRALCGGSANWSGSSDPSGGTPAAQNSIYNVGPDSTIPEISSFEIIDDRTLRFTFNEQMDSISLLAVSIEGVVWSNLLVGGSEFQFLTVELLVPIASDKLIQIQIDGARDCSGNVMDSKVFEFGIGVAPSFNELLISEIMADPEPTVGLPSTEYIELYNASQKLLSLNGIILNDATNAVALPATTIQPGEYLLLVPNAAVSAFSDSILLVGVSQWSALTNAGEPLSLLSQGELIFEVIYSDSWYSNKSHTDGGVSLEMKDLSNPCGGSINWGSSTAVYGGTPGYANANSESVPDNFGPELVSAEVISPSQVLFLFNEPLGINADQNVAYLSTPPIEVLQTHFGSNRKSLIAELAQPLEVNVPVAFKIFSVVDCLSNDLVSAEVIVVLPDTASLGDILISEILFNPRAAGVDFVELHNISEEKHINLNGWQIGRETNDGHEANPLNNTYVLAPGGYVAITTDTIILKNQYPIGVDKGLIAINQLPTFPNDAGSVLLLNASDSVVDRFDYDEDYHLIFLEEVEGVSLERISFKDPTNDPNNWTSASTSVGYATPGYRNSQSFEIPTISVTVKIEPKVFVPGSVNPAHQSFTTINYQLDKSGQFANVTVYNQVGEPVAALARNITLSTSGFIRWDGSDANGDRVRMGYYVVLFELYDGKGNKQVIKETVVVGR